MPEPNKYVVITSINAPGEAISRFSEWPGWQTVVVGDRKTPENWQCDGVRYLGIEEQYDLFGDFARAIPEDTYLRKMLGYAYCIRRGAAAIFESDDDNSPLPDAAKAIDGTIQGSRLDGRRLSSINHWLNIYEQFGSRHCWPRGFPLEFARQFGNAREGVDHKPWAVTQFLANNDPDCDAIYRMLDDRPVFFTSDCKVILDAGTYCPINSQATLWMPETFPLLFLPAGVPDRVTDILRGYIAQTCLWKAGYSAAFASPLVHQRRNAHDLHEDLLQEMPLYANANAWSGYLMDVQGTNMVECYRSAIRILSRVHAIPENNATLYDQFLAAAGGL